MDIFKIIDENESLSNELAEILSGSDSKKTKVRRLKTLRDNCEFPLAKAHAEYCIELLRKEQTAKLKHVFLLFFFLSYLIFTLCRVWWYYFPENNSFPKTNYTVSDLLTAMYALTIFSGILWGIRKAVLGIKSKNQ